MRSNWGGGWAVSPYPPFSRLRVTAGLVSKKVAKIEVASDQSREPCFSHITTSVKTFKLVFNRVNLTRLKLSYGDRHRSAELEPILVKLDIRENAQLSFGDSSNRRLLLSDGFTPIH